MKNMRYIVVAFLLVSVVVFSSCSKPQQQAVQTIDIQTIFGTIKYPAELEGYLRHDEITSAGVTMEVFYMQLPNGELELFRIYFGEDIPEGKMGYLLVDGREMPVSYATCEYGREDFPNSTSWERYFVMMDGFNIVLRSIVEMPGFSEMRETERIDQREVSLHYWTLLLPEIITCQESNAEGIYRANFYLSLGGENQLLYSFQLGEPSFEAVLGSYIVNGNKEVLSVESNDAVFNVQWSAEERQLVYDMMDTINDVINTIMSSKQFSAEP